MQRYIDLVQQAITEFSAHNFDAVTTLLLRAWQSLSIESLSMTPAFYNALCNAVEMMDLICQHFPSILYDGFLETSIQNLKNALEVQTEQPINLSTFNDYINAFGLCLQGLEFGVNFFSRQGLLNSTEPLFFFRITASGTLELYENTKINGIDTTAVIEAFNAALHKEKKSAEAYLITAQQLLEEKQFAAAEQHLYQMMKVHSNTQKEGFFHLAGLYAEQQAYERATDAYMKSMVFGMPKAVVGEQVKKLCSLLIRAAENPKEAKRWQELLIDFF